VSTILVDREPASCTLLNATIGQTLNINISHIIGSGVINPGSLGAVAEVVPTPPVPESTTEHNNIGADDSATESETESDREALRASLRKQKARNLHTFSEGTSASGSGIRKPSATQYDTAWGDVLVPDSEGELDLQQDSEKYVSLDTMIGMRGANV
jgi:hypothetical protein